MRILRQDLKYAARQLLKHPGFAAVTVLTLALGIGSNTAIFSVVNSVLLRPLPYRHGDRLVHIVYRAPAADDQGSYFSAVELGDYRQQSQTLAGVTEYHSIAFTLLGHGDPDRVETGVVAANYFHELGVAPVLGRTFRPDDERPGAEPVLLLSQKYWRRRFGSDPGVIGQTLRMNGKPITVVGVLPDLPDYPGSDDIFILTVSCPYRSSPSNVHNRSARMLSLYARIKPGVPMSRAQADVAMVARRLQQEYPESYPDEQSSDVAIVPVWEELTSAFRPTLVLLLATVGLVLLIACANVGNLTIARLLRREREVVIRAALGAGRGRLVRQMLTESTLLAFAGGALGLLFAFLGQDILRAFAQRFTARAYEIGIDRTVLLFTLALSLLTGLLFGFVPALQASRKSLAAAIQDVSLQSSASAGRHRLRSLLIIVQVAVSFMLLVGAGLTIRSLWKLRQEAPGFNPENVLTLTIDLPYSKYPEQRKIQAFSSQLIQRLEDHPGVLSAAVANDLPLSGGLIAPAFQIEGRLQAPQGPDPRADFHVVSEDYFRTLGIPLLKGRLFTAEDREDAPPVAVINDAMARQYWPGQDPLGKRIAMTSMGSGRWQMIVGIVGNVKQHGMEGRMGAGFYAPFSQTPGAGTFFVRTSGDPRRLIPDLRNAVRDLDPEQPIANIRTLSDLRADAMAPTRLTTVLIGLFAALAFTITVIGLSGVTALSVSERRQEIGIRTALGAGRHQVLRLILRQSLLLVLGGLALGAAGALSFTRLLSSLLFGIASTDPLTFVAVALLLLLVVGVACLVPARRASAIDPDIALRGSG